MLQQQLTRNDGQAMLMHCSDYVPGLNTKPNSLTGGSPAVACSTNYAALPPPFLLNLTAAQTAHYVSERMEEVTW